MIEYSKKKDKYILYTHDGSRVLGTHDTYEQALRQERAIQWSKHHRKNPITMAGRIGLDSVPMQFFNFYNDDGELVGEGDYEIVNSFEDMRLRWNHAPHEPELTALENVINGQFPIGVLVDIKISRLHRGKGYGQQITRETIEHMISSEGAKTILVIVETHPEEPYDLIPWYEMQGFEDLGIETQWGYPLMILR